MPFHLTPQQRFQLRRLLRTTDDLGAYRRTLALLQLDRGDTVTDVAAILGVSRRTVDRWIGGYWDHPVPRSLTTHQSTGRPSLAIPHRCTSLSGLLECLVHMVRISE